MRRQVLADEIGKQSERRVPQTRKGMRQLHMWLPDPWAPEFQAEARRQAALLRGAPEEAEALDFIEKIGDFADE